MNIEVYLLLREGCFYFHFREETLREAEYRTMNTFHIYNSKRT